METLTKKEFEEKFGTMAYESFGPNKREESLFSDIKRQIGEAAMSGVQKTVEGVGESFSATSPLKVAKGLSKVAAGPVETAFSPLAPIMAPISKAINYVGDKISNNPAVQKFADSKAGEVTQDVAEIAQNVTTVGGAIGGTKGLGSVKVPPIKPKIPGLPEGSVGKAAGVVGQAVRDVVPTAERMVDHNIARALDLTPGDLSNIAASTGNEVGRWMADNNLIGSNKANTLGLIRGFFETNYKNVRSEIAKVEETYFRDAIPHYEGILTQLADEMRGKIGLEKQLSEVNRLLKKDEVTLNDAQRVKELVDEHYQLYKITGDVKEGVSKQGLANVRTELKNFIEGEVQKNTGADIRAMNNNTMTARSLADAIEKRDPRGLTRAQVSWRDIAIGSGLIYFASPLVGIAAVLAMKVATSAPIRLRFARYVDKLTDAQKAKLSQQIRDDEVPKEVIQELGIKDDELRPDIQMGKGKIPEKGELPEIEF